MPAAALEALGNALGGLASSLVSMPVDAVPAPASTEPFGLTGGLGHRRFRRHLEVAYSASAEVEVLAMLGGQLSAVDSSSAVASSIGPAAHNRTPVGPVVRRADGSSHVFRAAIGAFVLRVTPLAPLRRATAPFGAGAPSLGGSARWTSPLDLPEPAWVVYEGGHSGWDVNHEAVAEYRRIFEGLPVDFPSPGELTTGTLPAALDAVRVEWQILLEDLAGQLLADPTLNLVILGHQDVGESILDEELGLRRAQLFHKLLQASTSQTLPTERVRISSETTRRPLFAGPDTGPRDEPERSSNRRVEVILRRRDPRGLAAGDRFAIAPAGTATSMRITILDQAGRFLDPLDVVRRYDLRDEWGNHPLAARRDPLAPAIASGWVHCVTDFDAGADGVADPAEAPFYTFERLAPTPDGRPALLAQSVVDAREVADVLLLDLAQARAALTIRHPISLVGNPRVETSDAGDSVTRRPLLTPDDSQAPLGDPLGALTPPRTITVEPVDPEAVGVRLLGLELDIGAAGVSSGAVFASDAVNFHVAGCGFYGNRARPLVSDGGAIALEHCEAVLIEDSFFGANSAHNGGAISGDACLRVVVAGRALGAAADAEYYQKLRGEVPIGGLLPYFSSQFYSNRADGRGGAIAFTRSTFAIANTSFYSNVAQGVGGAVAAALEDPGALAAARAMVRESREWPSAAPNAIAHCVMYMNTAAVAGGQIALWGAQDDPEVLVGAPRGSAGGGVCRLDENLLWGHRTFEFLAEPFPRAGGGVFLASGVFVLSGNRLSEHQASVQGGGVSCVADAHVCLRGNRIDDNTTDPVPPSLPDDPGAWGGGGVHAAGFGESDRTVVQLIGNALEGNAAPTSGGADGGGLLATCGARVVCGGAAPIEHNTFRGNRAASNGGAVSTRNADLEVRAGEVFVENRAEGGDGGAIFVAGMSMHASPMGHNAYQESAAGLASPLCADRGARLLLEGSAEAPVQLERNEAGGQGAAIAIVQEPAPPLYPPTPDSPLPTAVDRTVGLLRTAALRHARFLLNRSDEAEPDPGGGSAVTGSTVLLQGLDNTWVAEYDALAIRHVAGGPAVAVAVERDAWIGSEEPLGHCELAGLEITLDRGIGVLALRSTSIAVSAESVTVVELSGQAEGNGWRRYAAVDADRSLTR